MDNSTESPVGLSGAVYSVGDLIVWLFTIRDPKLDDFPLMGSPLKTIFIILFYTFLVRFAIPYVMENRKPFDLKYLLVFYNFTMVLINIWLHYEFWKSGWGTGYSFLCENIDYDINPNTMRMAILMWWYFMTKFIDMLDTIFIALKKKNEKITFLHYFHHGSMPLNIWVLTRFIPGGHCTFHGLLNTFVHSIMYFYYGVSALGPNYQKYLWWKKYVTLIQLIQFYMDCIHLALPFFFDCGFPKKVLLYMLSQASVFLVLFTEFYIRVYILAPKMKKKMMIANGHID